MQHLSRHLSRRVPVLCELAFDEFFCITLHFTSRNNDDDNWTDGRTDRGRRRRDDGQTERGRRQRDRRWDGLTDEILRWITSNADTKTRKYILPQSLTESTAYTNEVPCLWTCTIVFQLDFAFGVWYNSFGNTLVAIWTYFSYYLYKKPIPSNSH